MSKWKYLGKGIIQYKDGWYGIDYRDKKHHRIREKISPHKKDAEKALAIRKSEILQGKFHYVNEKKSPLFKDFAQECFDYTKNNTRYWKNVEIYNKHLGKYFNETKLSQIFFQDIERYKIERRNYVKEATVNRELSWLRRMFNLGIKWNKITMNPVKDVKFFHEEKMKERVLTQEEENKLLSNCNGYLKVVVIIAIYTGLRLREILNLKWKNVDLEDKNIFVEEGKGGKSAVIPINSYVATVLNEWKKDNYNNEYVFVNPKTRKPYWDISKSWYRAVVLAGIPKIRFHDLRHTFATRLAQNGVDTIHIAKLTRHSSIKMVERYVHPMFKNLREGVESLIKFGHFLDTPEKNRKCI